jgi:hypothetical protein
MDLMERGVYGTLPRFHIFSLIEIAGSLFSLLSVGYISEIKE